MVRRWFHGVETPKAVSPGMGTGALGEAMLGTRDAFTVPQHLVNPGMPQRFQLQLEQIEGVG